MRWEEWLPDGLHPTSRGSLSYAHSVIAFLEAERKRRGGDEGDRVDGTISRTELPEPLDPEHWGNAYNLPLAAVETEGPWVLKRWLYYEWIEQVLETAAVGAKLRFTFEGRGLSLGFDFGKASAEFRYRIDDGEWITAVRDRPEWCGVDGWYRTYFCGDDWNPGAHRFELEVINGNRPECQGTNFRLGNIGVIR
jgi:hypothetical protein